MKPVTTRVAPLILTGKCRRNDPGMIPEPDEHGFDPMGQ